jgi:hypothetical protein
MSCSAVFIARLLWVEKVVVNQLFGAQLKGNLEDSEKARGCLRRLLAIPLRSKRELLQAQEAKEMLAKMER